MAAMYPNLAENPELNFNRQSIIMRNDFVNYVRYQFPLQHAFLTIMIFLTNNPIFPIEALREPFAVIGMLIIVNILVETTVCFTVYPWELPWGLWTPDVRSSVIFLTIDWVSITGIIFGNILFLIIRSFCRHKVNLNQVCESKQIPSADSVIAMKTVMEQFSTHFVCTFICLFSLTPESQVKGTVIKNAMIVSLVLITLLIFVHWKKGPTWWVRVGPYLQIGCVLADYILLPVALLTYIVIEMVKGIDLDSRYITNPFETNYIFFMSICLGRFIEFLAIIKPKIAQEKENVLRRYPIQSANVSELEHELAIESEASEVEER